MLCPACKVHMLVLEFERVEIDYCSECGGVWLDSGELELIGERAGALQAGLLAALEGRESERARGSGKRRCPICLKRLVRVRCPGESAVTLDRCPAQHGLWFDRGELPTVIRSAGAEKDDTLIRFFARLQARGKGEQRPEEEGGG